MKTNKPENLEERTEELPIQQRSMHERLFNSLMVASYGILGYYYIKSTIGIANHIIDYISK